MGTYAWVLALVLAVPFASASDPLNEPVCDETLGCFGAGACVADVTCVPPLCNPNLRCTSEVSGTGSGCSVNETIDGETCATYVALGGGTDRHTTVPGVGNVGTNGLMLVVSTSEGHVSASNLPNTWIAPGAELSASAADGEPATTGVGVYRSDVDVEGDSGLPATPATSPRHRYTQVALDVHHRSAVAGEQGIVVGIVLLDLAPEGCFVRSPGATVKDTTCREAVEDLTRLL